ncbi:MAG TPA: ABC transporter permease [Methylomirabilota bacterium]|nr:ABC transporter permease [Methylomirabilota bacterium]
MSSLGQTLHARLLRIVGLFRRQQRERELAEELESHLQLHIEDNLRAGMTLEAARRDALLRLGGVEQTKEICRDQRGIPFLEALFRDVRYTLRVFHKTPGFTAVVALTLALGIGANSAIFSLVNGILLVSLPYAKPEQLVSITGTYPKGGIVAMREQMRTMDIAAYYEGREFNLTGAGEPVRLTGTLVSAELFSVLGARPELGRTFYPGEDLAGQDSYIILSHALWQQRFGGDRAILGRTIGIEGAGRQVVGVMPEDFRFPSPKTQVWIPLHNDSRNAVLYWADDFMPVVGRLRPGFTIEQARTEIRLFQSRVASLFPWPMPVAWNADVSVVPLQSGMVADVRLRLLMLLGAVALVVLIACANFANLMLARSAIREKEIAIRTALGAGRSRIVGQLLTESVMLGCLGGALGLALAFKGLSILKAMLPADTPRLADSHMDWRVLAFTGVLAIFTGLISGLAPALQSSRTASAETLRSGGRSGSLPVSQRLRSGLVVAEVAFAVLLVIAAGLLIRSFWALSHVDRGFRSEHVLTARITPNQSFCNDPARCVTFYRTLLDQVRALPGVSAAAVVNTLPLDGRVAKRSLDVEDFLVPAGGNAPLFWLNAVSSDYFRVMNIPALAGRVFTDADVSGAPVAVITSETARRYWPNQNAVGKHIRLLNDKDWRTIVGVIPDVRAYDLRRNIPKWIDGVAYVPYNSAATLEDKRVPAEMTIVLRTASDDAQIAATLRTVVASVNPEAPVSEVQPMDLVVLEAVAAPRATAVLFMVFAGLALALGVIGIYGVLSFLVSNRTREIGIRMALGAQRRSVLWSVMKEGGALSLIGIALGMAGAFALMRLLSTELYAVHSTDPATYAAVAIIIAAAASLACYIPAHRATRVDPMIALRYE